MYILGGLYIYMFVIYIADMVTIHTLANCFAVHAYAPAHCALRALHSGRQEGAQATMEKKRTKAQTYVKSTGIGRTGE